MPPSLLYLTFYILKMRFFSFLLSSYVFCTLETWSGVVGGFNVFVAVSIMEDSILVLELVLVLEAAEIPHECLVYRTIPSLPVERN